MKIKSSYFLFIVILTVDIINAYSQSTDTLKTVFQLFNLPSEGCELSKSDPATEELSLMMDPYSVNQNEAIESNLTALIEKYTPLFERDDKISAKFEEPIKPEISFKNGNHSFKQNNKYGLMDVENNIIIPASFHTIKQNGEDGFVAYTDQLCNYYSNDGHKILNEDYYFIKPTVKNSLIVQTKDGYGVITKENKTIITPAYFQIQEVYQKEQFYYWIRESYDHNFYLNEDAKDTIYLNAQPSEFRIIDAIYWEYYGDIINTKTKRNVVCGNYYIEIVSSEHQLARIKDKKTKSKYLMKCNGDLVTNQPFVDISSFKENNLAIASIKEENRILYGLLNPMGEWIIEPQYNRLYFINNTHLAAGNSDKKCGIITINDEVVLPFEYRNIYEISEHYALCVGSESSDIIDLRSKKILKSDLPYISISKAKRCDFDVFIAKGKKRECVVNDNFEQISPANYTRVFYGPDNNSFVGTDFLENNNRKSQVFDCNGQLKTLNINKKEYSTFYNYEEITPELHHILLASDTGYFVHGKGKLTEDNTHWQNIEYSNVKDLFTTMKYGGTFGIINSMGETVIPPIFEFIGTFDKRTGLARYNFDNKQKGYLTTKGELLFGTKYLETIQLNYGTFKVKKDEKWGVVNRNGDEIVPLNYSKVWLNGGIIHAEHGNSVEYFDIFGNRIN